MVDRKEYDDGAKYTYGHHTPIAIPRSGDFPPNRHGGTISGGYSTCGHHLPISMPTDGGSPPKGHGGIESGGFISYSTQCGPHTPIAKPRNGDSPPKGHGGIGSGGLISQSTCGHHRPISLSSNDSLATNGSSGCVEK